MADDEYKVQVKGVKEMVKALKALDADLPKQLRKSFLVIAGKIADRIRSGVPVGPTGHAAGSVKARATQRGASVVGGGAAAPYYPWLDFGGGRKHARGVQPGGSPGSFRRTYFKEGRYMFPVIHDELEDTLAAAQQALRDAAKSAGWGWEEL
jgi:hypothetical protein